MQEKEKVPGQAENGELRDEEIRRILQGGVLDLKTVERYAEESNKYGRKISIYDPLIGTSDKLFFLVLVFMLMLTLTLTVVLLNYRGLS